MHNRIQLPNLTTVSARIAVRRKSVSAPPIGRPPFVIDQFSRARPDHDEVLGFAAHELRNPLSIILGMSEFLRDGVVGELTSQQRHLVTTILGACRTAIDLVNQLLDAEREPDLKCERHDVAALVSECVAQMSLEAMRKDMDIAFTPPGPVELMMDREKIKQVVTNLLSNAIKYSPPGSTITVTLASDPGAGSCVLAVRDQGPGVPEHERDRLFTAFGRLSVKPTGGEKSTGLGLALCRRFVEAHHGSIDARNLAEGGCEFAVALPLQPQLASGDEAAGPQVAAQPVETSAPIAV